MPRLATNNLTLDWYWQSWACPPLPTVSEWADQHRKLSMEDSTGGQWHTSRFPYQRAIMDALSDLQHEIVVFVSATQVGKTQIALNWIGQTMDVDPCPMMITVPTIDDARNFSKLRLAPMLRDTPRLYGKVRETRGKQSKEDGGTNEVQVKSFPGGYLKLVGSNSASGLRSNPIRKAYFDELDACDPSAGDEGDQVELIRRRQDQFWNAKLFLTTSPTLKATSRGWRWWLRSNQQRFYVPCPHCETLQVLLWENFHWDKGEDNRPLPLTAHFQCIACKERIDETYKEWMLASGEWRAERPEEKRIAGFWIWAAYAKAWPKIVEEFYDAEAGGDQSRKVFKNTVRAEPWEEASDAPEWAVIRDRADTYQQWTVPHGCGFLTMGVDVQDDRLVYSVWGWGREEEGWLIGHEVLWGNTDEKAVYGVLDQRLALHYAQPTRQRTLPITLCCMDSGHKTNEVYIYARTRPNVYAIKGSSDSRTATVGLPTWQDVDYKGRKVKQGVQLWPVGVHRIKKLIYGRLRIPRPGARYLHFCHGMGDDYYLELTAEKLVITLDRGFPKETFYLERPRNEGLDCAVYSYAAAYLAGLADPRMPWDRMLGPAESAPMSAPQPVQQSQGSSPPLILAPALPDPQQQQGPLTPPGRRMRRSGGMMGKLLRGE